MYDTFYIMKKFVFDSLVDEENFCNFKKERELLLKYIEQQANVVLYAPRNYGKTSLIKNLIYKDFKQRNKKSFFLYVDLIEVKSRESMEDRIIKAFEHYFSLAFPVKKLVDEVKSQVLGLKPDFSLDPVTGNITIKINPKSNNNPQSLADIFAAISNISQKIPTLLVFDEFQDIALLDEAQGIFRSLLESVNKTATIVLGSKQHMLADIFSNPKAPLAMWGKDVSLPPIDYERYLQYILERFKVKNILIDLKEAVYLQDIMHRIPEAINILCQQILDDCEGLTVTENIVNSALLNLLEQKQSRYENYLAHFSINEEKLFVVLSRNNITTNPQGKELVKQLQLTHRTIGSLMQKNIKAGIIENIENGYRLSDPLFSCYLKKYR